MTPEHKENDMACESAQPKMTVTLIVGGNDVVMVAPVDQRLGVLAHAALAAEEYDWTEIELRDRDGNRLAPNARVGQDIAWPVSVNRPVGWGG